MDVTAEILRNNDIYGASDYTGAHTLSASRSLNYAKGTSITKPAVENLRVIPYTFNYQDAVGLFGAENCFIRVNVDIDRDYSKDCYEEPWYDCAELTEDREFPGYYNTGTIDYDADPIIVNEYEPADIQIQSKVPLLYDQYISVDLKNLKVNNRYIDDWLDVRLYTKNREEHAEDFMYVRLKDYFYIGIHARNTRRLPYNIQLTVGAETRSELPTDECKDEWEIIVDPCECVEEKDWVCAEMSLYSESGTNYQSAVVDMQGDPNTENSYQPSRVTLQGNECIIDTLSDYLQLPRRGKVGHVPPPKAHANTTKAHMSEPCCTSCG